MKFNSDYQALAHHWAYNNNQSECRDKRMFSEYDKIYSYGYHYCIAAKVRNKAGGIEFVAFNAYTNSRTTNKQRNIVRQAIRHLDIIEMPRPEHWKDWKTVLKHHTICIEDALKRASRARTRKEEYERGAEYHLWQLQTYFKGLDTLKVKYDKRKISKKWKDILFNGEEMDSEQIAADKIRAEKAALAAKRRKERKAAKEEDKTMKLWLSGDIGRTPYFRYQKETRLRIYGENVQTSQGISVDLKAAKVLWSLIKAGKNVRGHNIDGFHVISLNGTLKIGCHDIPRKEVDRIGKVLDS